MKRVSLRDFFAALQKGQSFKEMVYLFTGGVQAPLSIIAPLREKIAQQNNLILTALAREQLGEHTAQNSQHQMFTSEQLFWLTQAYTDLASKELELVYSIFSNATKQSRYCAYIPTVDEKKIKSPEKILIIVVPETCTKADVQMVQQLLEIPLAAAKEAVLYEVMRQHEKLTLDDVAMLVRYIAVTGGRYLPQAQDMLLSLYQVDSSLFDLSHLFFARKKQDFFALWDRLSSEYPPIFWVSFWSDLVWRAYHFIHYQRASKSAEAKKISVRLPFNFVQQHWKITPVEQLSQALHFLYELDLRFKKSSEFCGFELLFTRYFAE